MGVPQFGIHRDAENQRVNINYAGTRMLSVTASGVEIPLGLLQSSPSSAMGYSTGAGGAVTQLVDATTAVTLDKPCGQITTVALTTAGAAEEVFVVNNALVDANDVIAVSTTYAGQGKPIVFVTNVGAGSFRINITNVSASALDAVLVINFVVIKAVVA